MTSSDDKTVAFPPPTLGDASTEYTTAPTGPDDDVEEEVEQPVTPGGPDDDDDDVEDAAEEEVEQPVTPGGPDDDDDDAAEEEVEQPVTPGGPDDDDAAEEEEEEDTTDEEDEEEDDDEPTEKSMGRPATSDRHVSKCARLAVDDLATRIREISPRLPQTTAIDFPGINPIFKQQMAQFTQESSCMFAMQTAQLEQKLDRFTALNARALEECQKWVGSRLDIHARRVETVVNETKTEVADIVNKTKTEVKDLIAEGGKVLRDDVNAVNIKMAKLEAKLECPVISKLKSPQNIGVRQVLEWIMHFGPDTMCTSGMFPIFYTTNFPGRPEITPANNITVISWGGLQLIECFGEEFTPAIQKGLGTAVKKTISSVLSCITELSINDVRVLQSRFPMVPYRGREGIFVCFTEELAECLKAEQMLMNLGRRLLPEVTNIHVPDNVTVKQGGGKMRGNLAPKKKVSREFSSMEILEAKQRIYDTYNVNLTDKQLFNEFSTCFQWGTEASKAFLSRESFHIGCSIIRKALGLETPAFDPKSPFHVGANFEMLGNEEVQSFAAIMDNKHNQGDVQYRNEFITAGIDRDDEVVARPVKKRKRRN